MWSFRLSLLHVISNLWYTHKHTVVTHICSRSDISGIRLWRLSLYKGPRERVYEPSPLAAFGHFITAPSTALLCYQRPLHCLRSTMKIRAVLSGKCSAWLLRLLSWLAIYSSHHKQALSKGFSFRSQFSNCTACSFLGKTYLKGLLDLDNLLSTPQFTSLASLLKAQQIHAASGCFQPRENWPWGNDISRKEPAPAWFTSVRKLRQAEIPPYAVTCTGKLPTASSVRDLQCWPGLLLPVSASAWSPILYLFRLETTLNREFHPLKIQ